MYKVNTILLKMIILSCTLFSFKLSKAQSIGTYSFTNAGGSGLKNIWTNSFNWVTWNGSTWAVSGLTPSSTNDVIINLDNLLASGTPTISGVSSANRLLIDASVSCRSFSVVGTVSDKGIRTGSNINFDVNGNFDLSGAPKCAFDGISYGSGYTTINLKGNAGGPYNIKTKNNALDIVFVNVLGDYQLQDNFAQFPVSAYVSYASFSNFQVTGTGKFKTNGYRFNAYYFAGNTGSTVDFSNSIFNLNRLDIYTTPVTVGNEEFYFSDTINNNLGKFQAYIIIQYGAALNVRKISNYQVTFPSVSTVIGGPPNTLRCKLFELNTSLNLNPYSLGFNNVTIDTLRIKEKAVIYLGSANTYTTIETPGICSKNVTFKSIDNYNNVAITVNKPVTLNYTSWLDMNVSGAGSIVANNSNDLGNNSGSLTINTTASRNLAWCGSVNDDWDNSNNWRLVSTPGCGVCPPTNKDSVVFDPIYLSGASTKSVNIATTALCNGINFLYPNSTPFYVIGRGIIINSGGLWVGYPSGLVANTSLKGTDFSNYTGQIIMNTSKKMVMLATQNTPMNALGTNQGYYFGGLNFMGGGKWFFKDDFTANRSDFTLSNGNVLCGKRNLTFVAAQVTPKANKIAKLNLDTCSFTITGSAGYFYTNAGYSNKVFLVGGKSTLLFNSSINGGSYGSNPSLYCGSNAKDSTGVRCVNYWNVKYSSTITYASLSRQYGVGNFYIHKLTLPSAFFSGSDYMAAVDAYPYLEVDSLDISNCDKFNMQHYTSPNSKAIKINQAIVTSTLCGSYNNVFSDDAILPADIIVPADFGTNKVLVQNVTINNGAGTLTANNSIKQGITTGWVIPPSGGTRFYWNGEGANTNWNNPRNWNVNVLPNPLATDDALFNASGCVPGPLDSVFFTNNAFPITNTVTLKNADYAKTIIWNLTDKPTNSITWKDTIGANLNIYESLIMNDRPKPLYTCNTYFWGTSANNILKSSSRVFNCTLYFEGSGTYTLADSLAGNGIYMDAGNFNSNSKNINLVTYFYSYKPTVRSINVSNSAIRLTSGYGYDYIGGYGCWHYNSNNATLSAAGSTIYISGGYGSSGFIGGSSITNTGTNTAQYNRVIFYGTTPASALGGVINSGSDNLFSFNKVDFQVIATKILGSNRIDTLLYAPMSVNELQVGKTQSVDSLKAISNNCLNIVIKSTTSGVYSDICDIGSFKKLSATFGDIIDIRSNLCSGFIPSNDVFNGSVSNAPGWVVNSSALTFGFPIKTLTTTCRITPYNITSNGFYPGITSTYLWSNGATTSSISVNAPGVYSLTVNYKTGCSITDAVTINLTNNLAGTFSVTPVKCNGQSNAIVSFSLTADTAYNHTYQYNWAIPSSSVNSIYTSSTNNLYSSLIAGIYTLTIIDTTSNSTLCQYTRTVSVNEPLALTTAVSSNSILCYGLTTGSLNALSSGGNAGYTYNWFDGTSTYTTQNLTNQGAGNYSLTVTDSKNCTVKSTYTISQPSSPVTATVSSLANVKCFGQSTGAATITAIGGTGAATYTWIPSGGNNAIASGLGSNNYTVNVLDANNCPTSTTLSITQPTSALSISASSQTNVSCNSYSNAAASVSVTGGTSGYSYTWNTGTSTIQTLNTISVGNYTASITDGNGCVVTQSFVITGPAILQSTILSSTQANCNSSNGSASYSVSGGTPSYTYSWTTPSTSYTTSALSTNSLSAGTNQLMVIDANGCVTNTTVVITNPNSPTITVTTNSVLCKDNNTGSINTTVIGGTPTYSYSWSNGSNASNLSNLAAGGYTVIVIDVNNCLATQSASITQPTSTISLVVSSIIGVNCFGQSTGAATITAIGGTGAATYTWIPSGGNNAIASGLGSNNYTVNVLDANNCPTSTTLSITQPTSALSISASSQTNVSCNSYSNAVASVSATGGTSGYSYTWNTGTSTIQTLNAISVGNYTAYVTDANGCVITQTFIITEPAVLQSTILSTTQANCGSSNGSASYSVSGGTPSYTYSWTTPSMSYTTNALSTNSLSAGTNQLMVIDVNGCVTNTSVVITNPNSPTITVTTNSIICFGINSGAVNTSVIGGTPTYSYSWSNGANSSNISNLAAGTYTVIVVDVNNCLTTQSASIAQPTSAIAMVVSNISNVNCFGQNTGSANAIVNGGTPSYTYTWLPVNNNTANLINASAGIYTITVMDANGCSTGSVITINSASSSSLLATIASSTQATCGSDNGEAFVNAVGGSPNYNYLWLPNNLTSANVTGLAVGSYTVIVSDTYNCKDTITFQLDCKTALFIPEMFSPNADGKNDFFVIKGIESYPNNSISIFNRWGGLVYFKEKYNNTWNGTASVSNATGKGLLPASTYFVVFDFGDNTSKPYHGFVELKY